MAVLNRIRKIRTGKGMSLEKLADLSGISPSYISRMEAGARNVSLKNLEAIASALGVAPGDLLAETSPVTVPSPLPAHVAPPPPNARFVGAVDLNAGQIPVYGSAVGGPDGRTLFNGEIVAYVPVPPQLANVRGAYGAYVSGDSMEARYYSGELVFVAPNKPVRRGDFVVVQLHAGVAGEAPHGFVKRFVSLDKRHLRLEQFNPKEALTFPADQVRSIHRIVLSGEG